MSQRGRAAVFGACGQIGREVVRSLAAFGLDTAGFGRAQCDVTDAKAIGAALNGFDEGDVIVNAAAYNDVARAEERFAEALLANGCAPYLIGLAANRCRATFVQFGTDYVFDGQKASPYVESDAVHPLNAYGRTKLCGEALAAAVAPRHYIVRVSTVFGITGNPTRKNFVERVIAASENGATLRLMEDGAMSPTYAADAADLVTGILRADAPCGTYHLSNSGACSWFDFAGEIARQCGIAPQLTGLDARDTDARVQRPLNSALSSEYLIGLGLRPRSWQDGVRRYLKATGRLDDR